MPPDERPMASDFPLDVGQPAPEHRRDRTFLVSWRYVASIIDREQLKLPNPFPRSAQPDLPCAVFPIPSVKPPIPVSRLVMPPETVVEPDGPGRVLGIASATLSPFNRSGPCTATTNWPFSTRTSRPSVSSRYTASKVLGRVTIGFRSHFVARSELRSE